MNCSISKVGITMMMMIMMMMMLTLMMMITHLQLAVIIYYYHSHPPESTIVQTSPQPGFGTSTRVPSACWWLPTIWLPPSCCNALRRNRNRCRPGGRMRPTQGSLPTGYSCRRKFRSQTSDNMDRWKAEQGRGREKRKIRRERVRRKKMQMHEKAGKSRKGRKVAKHCVFPMICGSRGSKSRLAKAAGAETSGEMRTEKLHAVVARSRFWSKKV